MSTLMHSVTLDQSKCIGCTDCIKRCPTEAIRVRNSKAVIIDERCIDCGNCIRICRNSAKRATTDSLSRIDEFQYKVAIPAPSLYSQFRAIDDPNIILNGIKSLGFDEVFEVSKAAEFVSNYTEEFVSFGKFKKPLISSACPVVIKLIQMRFPSLIPNILPVISPKEAMARFTKNYLEKQGIKREEIGVFFISPCAAKVTNTRQSEVLKESYVDGVISMREVYLKLFPLLKKIKDPEPLRMSDIRGIAWCSSGGEGKATHIENHIAVDGIDNVIRILERIEDGKLDVDFVECLACVNGCLGGPLTIEDSFVAIHRMEVIQKFLAQTNVKRDLDIFDPRIKLSWDFALRTKQVMKLDEDMSIALQKIERIETLYDTLPQIDCGSCGAPTCRASAEDVVQGEANLEDCIFMLRQKVRDMAADMLELAQKMPNSLDKSKM